MSSITVVLVALICSIAAISCNPLPDATKIKPVDLAHVCMKVGSEVKPADDAPIILIHGLGASGAAWKGIREVLSLKTGRKVCTVDLRNHDDSPWSDQANTEFMAADLSHLLDTLKIKEAIVLGHSLGGKTAVHFAVNYPDRVRKLIVEDMRPNGISDEALTMVTAMLSILTQAIDEMPEGIDEKQARKLLVEFMNKKLKESGSSETITESTAEAIRINCKKPKCDFGFNLKVLSKYLAKPEELLVETRGTFEKPAMFIYGKESPFKVGDDEENIKKMFPQAELVGIDGAGHVVQEKTREYLSAVIKFINGK